MQLSDWIAARIAAGTAVTFEPSANNTVTIRLAGPTHWFEIAAHRQLLADPVMLVSFLEHEVMDGLRRSEGAV